MTNWPDITKTEASHQEVENIQARQMQGFLDCQSGIEPVKRTIAKMKAEKAYGGKLHNPRLR